MIKVAYEQKDLPPIRVHTMGIERTWTRCGFILMLLNIVPEDTELTQYWKSEICTTRSQQNHWVIFISLFCYLMIQSLLIMFPNCWILSKISHVEKVVQKRNLSWAMLIKQSSACFCVFSCEYNPFLVTYCSCCHPNGDPLWWCHLQSHIVKSPPLLTKCCAYLPGPYSQACWHTRCALSHSQFISAFPCFLLKSCL